ncbi:uncharacterized protein [Ptychodera flava]|uniref:uncharacterized protein n=1 Tax=Ptychodera flava TaxID=63121 RepID=UPI00396A7B8D
MIMKLRVLFCAIAVFSVSSVYILIKYRLSTKIGISRSMDFAPLKTTCISTVENVPLITDPDALTTVSTRSTSAMTSSTAESESAYSEIPKHRTCRYLDTYIFMNRVNTNCTFLFEYLTNCVNRTGIGRTPLPNFFFDRQNGVETSDDAYRRANVAFVHMPKAGGTSVEDVLMKIPALNDTGVVRKKRVSHCGDLYGNGQRFKKYTNQTLFYSKRTFGLHDFAFQGRPFAYVTWLREPIDRLVSMYFYGKRKGCFVVHEICYHYLAKSETLTDYLMKTTDIHFQDMDNFYVRLLQFGDFPDVDATFEDCCGGVELKDVSIIPKIEEKHYLVAKENLWTKMAFVGLTEDFKTSQDMLSYVFGIPNEGEVIHINANSHKDYNLTDFEIDELRRRNMWDIKLYEEAQKIYELQKKIYLEWHESQPYPTENIDNVLQ